MNRSSLKFLRIAIVVGEPSGDKLGASLLVALKNRYPHIVAEGVGGEALIKVGFKNLFSMDKLAFVGIIEPLKHLPQILYIRRQLIQHFLQHRPDVFIGIDAPGFNLSLERVLKSAGITTVHYVSPSIWAWRSKRIHKIKAAVDLMLCLFPFEPALYHKHHVKAEFIGHPLADQIPIDCNQWQARMKFFYKPEDKVLAVLPGSRESEVKYLAPLFIKVIRHLQVNMPQLKVIVPMVDQKRYTQFIYYLKKIDRVSNVTVVIGQSQEAMTAADTVLLSCGTASLEAMLIPRPMVVAYKLSSCCYFLGRHLIHTQYFSLPNILSGEALVPEFIQRQATVAHLSTAVLRLWDENHQALMQKFSHLGKILRQDASEKAADHIFALINP